MNKKILIIGNGSSTRLLAERGFHKLPSDLDSFGMGIAYRYFYGIDWWPTYYACCDSKVVFSHRVNFKRLIEDAGVTTKKCFFPLELSKSRKLEVVPHSSTGDFCFKKAVELGYKEIYLIGIEGHYIEEIIDSRAMNESEVNKFHEESGIEKDRLKNIRVIKKTPIHADNYFFSWYQQKKDIYSLPMSAKHRSLWQKAAQKADAADVRVKNLSDRTLITAFQRDSVNCLFYEKQISGSSPQERPSRNVLIFFPTTRTDDELLFWSLLCKKLSSLGWNPIIIYRGSQQNILALSDDANIYQFYFNQNNLRCIKDNQVIDLKNINYKRDLLGCFVFLDLFSKSIEFNVADLKNNNASAKAVVHSLTKIIQAAQPSAILINNDTHPLPMMVESVAKEQGLPLLFTERSPLTNQWLEPYGFYAEAVAIKDLESDLSWRYDASLDALGTVAMARLEVNPAMHRQSIQEQGFQTKEFVHAKAFGTTAKPIFLLPMDHVLNTGWILTGHPKRALNYPLFETPFDAIRKLSKVAKQSGAELWIKPHPGDPLFNSLDEFEGVKFYRGDIDNALARSSLVFCFLTKVAYAALAQKKKTVLLSPSVAEICPAAFKCNTVESIDATVAHALAHDWTDEDTIAVRRFLGWLERDYFIANDLNNPAAERLFTHYFPKASDDLSIVSQDDLEIQLQALPGATVPKRPVGSPINPDSLVGDFERDHDMRLDEVDVIKSLFQNKVLTTQQQDYGVMLDVGACKGSAFAGFADMGWEIHAFEPNPPMHAHILANSGHHARLTLNPLAVSEVSGQEVPFYTSEESIGISTMSPFRDTHKPTAIAKTIRLDDYCQQRSIDHADFLKIDTEGFDLMVLKGHDWELFKPNAIICEYEDFKTEKLGYHTEDTAAFLQAKGYTVYVSEWHPIIQYGGGTHRWRALNRWRPGVAPPNSWGNLLAFREPISERILSASVQQILELSRLKRLKADLKKTKLAQQATVLKRSASEKSANSNQSTMAHAKKTLSLRLANQLLRDGDYQTAMEMYVILAERSPLKMYEDNALFAAYKLGMGTKITIGELRKSLNNLVNGPD